MGEKKQGSGRIFWRKAWSPAGLTGKDFLRYECNRLGFDSDSCYPMNATGYGLFRILAIPLHFLIDILDICLEWIMKATCCLLRYNRAFMFGIVNLSMSYLCCEMPQKSCQYLHLILFFSSSQRAHG